MAVLQLTSNLMGSFYEFAKKFEYKSISMISRMYHKDKLTIPSSSVAKVFCEVTESNPDIILNVIMITSGGILMPMFSDVPPSGPVITEMVKMVIDYKKTIFCILGVSGDTELVKKKLNYSVLSKIDYILFRENDKTIFETDKAFFRIKKAKKLNASGLLPLEKAYLIEEVLIGSSTPNHRVTMVNLQKTCSTQSVYYALSGREIIGKVNTNAKGIGYNQIGGVYTKPEFRNSGVSTNLMKVLLNEIHMNGKKGVLYVKKANKPALALYRKLGFSIIDEYCAHYVKP